VESVEFRRVTTAGRCSQAANTMAEWCDRSRHDCGADANFIGVGESEKIESVAAKMMGKNQPGGLLVYRRYEP
jgi:hypothetical protein